MMVFNLLKSQRNYQSIIFLLVAVKLCFVKYFWAEFIDAITDEQIKFTIEDAGYDVLGTEKL